MADDLFRQFEIGPAQQGNNYALFPAPRTGTTEVLFAVLIDSMNPQVEGDCARLLERLKADLEKTTAALVQSQIEQALANRNTYYWQQRPIDGRGERIYFSALILALTRQGNSLRLQGAHIGNCHAYIGRNQQWQPLNQPQLWGPTYYANTPEERKRLGAERWYAPTHTLGSSRTLDFDIYTSLHFDRLEAGERLLLCTYPLAEKLLQEPALGQLASQRSVNAAAQALAQAAPPKTVALLLQWPRPAAGVRLPGRRVFAGLVLLVLLSLLVALLYRFPTQVDQTIKIAQTGICHNTGLLCPTPTPEATATSTATPTPTATDTATSPPLAAIVMPPSTPSATATPTNTALPTRRPTPIPTARPTFTLAKTPTPPPTSTPTNTPLPPTATATVLATVTSSSIATETQTPTATVTSQVTIVQPGDTNTALLCNQVSAKVIPDSVPESLSQSYSFSWTKNCDLPPGYVFELGFWQGRREDRGKAQSCVGASDAQRQTVSPECFRQRGGGEYFWAVFLAQTDPSFNVIKPLSDIYTIRVELPSAPTSGSSSGPAPCDINTDPACQSNEGPP